MEARQVSPPAVAGGRIAESPSTAGGLTLSHHAAVPIDITSGLKWEASSRDNARPRASAKVYMTQPRIVRAPRGAQLNCKGWHQEAALRCLMNNLDPEVAERPRRLVVYGGTGKAARNWAIVRRDRARAATTSRTTRRCSCNPASPSASFARTNMRRAS